MSDGSKLHIQSLLEGIPVKFRPHGNSMVPIIYSGQLVTISPLTREPEVGDAVLCKVRGRQMLHKVIAIGSDGRFQIGNNHGLINGWCTRQNIFGVLTCVEP
jgi:hypothetical protein